MHINTIVGLITAHQQLTIVTIRHSQCKRVSVLSPGGIRKLKTATSTLPNSHKLYGTGTYICCGRGRSTDTADPADMRDSCEGSGTVVTPAEMTQDTARRLSTSATRLNKKVRHSPHRHRQVSHPYRWHGDTIWKLDRASSCLVLLPIGQYQLILLGDRGTYSASQKSSPSQNFFAIFSLVVKPCNYKLESPLDNLNDR